MKNTTINPKDGFAMINTTINPKGGFAMINTILARSFCFSHSPIGLIRYAQQRAAITDDPRHGAVLSALVDLHQKQRRQRLTALGVIPHGLDIPHPPLTDTSGSFVLEGAYHD